jgi:hypothetical protein
VDSWDVSEAQLTGFKLDVMEGQSWLVGAAVDAVGDSRKQ